MEPFALAKKCSSRARDLQAIFPLLQTPVYRERHREQASLDRYVRPAIRPQPGGAGVAETTDSNQEKKTKSDIH